LALTLELRPLSFFFLRAQNGSFHFMENLVSGFHIFLPNCIYATQGWFNEIGIWQNERTLEKQQAACSVLPSYLQGTGRWFRNEGGTQHHPQFPQSQGKENRPARHRTSGNDQPPFA